MVWLSGTACARPPGLISGPGYLAANDDYWRIKSGIATPDYHTFKGEPHDSSIAWPMACRVVVQFGSTAFCRDDCSTGPVDKSQPVLGRRRCEAYTGVGCLVWRDNR